MDNIIQHPDIADDSQIKQKALDYLPRNLGDVSAQQHILRMIALVAPAVTPFIRQADEEIWDKVPTGELSINEAIAQCAFRVDTIIETTAFSKERLLHFAEKDLLGAWIALDYYAYILRTEYSINILQLREQISEALRTEKTVPNAVVDYDVTQPADPPSIPENTQKTNQQIVLANYTDNHTVLETAPGKKPKKPATGHDQTWFQKNGKKAFILFVVAAAIILAIAFFTSDVQQTKSAINKIKDVTLDSESQIMHAEELFAGLNEDQQKKVSNHSQLLSARAEYDSLVTEAAIEKIGTVTLESKDNIVHAEELYAALSRDSKNLVDNYKTLTAARKEYDRLDTAVKTAEKAIDAIGQVTLQSGKKITDARNAYDALEKDNLQKYLSGKVSKLTDAEDTYKQLVSQDFYDTGLAHHEEKNYEEAIKCFDTIIKDYSDTKILDNAKTAKVDSQLALAEQSYSKKDYYTTMKTLSAVEAAYQQQENYLNMQEKTLKAIDKARPRNGALVAGKSKWGYCHFKITAKDQDVCFKFQDTKNPDEYKLVFVRAGESTKFNIADGTYSVKYATGKYWYGTEHLFGDDTQYFGKGNVDFETTRSGNWIYYWTYTLDMTKSDFLSYTIDANEF